MPVIFVPDTRYRNGSPGRQRPGRSQTCGQTRSQTRRHSFGGASIPFGCASAGGKHQNAGATGMWKGRMGMGRIIKALVLLVIVAFIGLVAYSYVADLSPRQGEVTVPVTLDAP